MLTVKDLEKIQALLPDHQAELVNGKVVIMSPSGFESDEVAFRFGGKLFSYVDERKLGRIAGSSGGFTLPNSNTRAPDVSFVKAERLRRSPRGFAQLAPDLAVEVKSPSDSLDDLRAKLTDFLTQGTQVGILINPEQRWLEIHRPNQPPVCLNSDDILTIPELFPGWSLPLSEIWPPEF
jgi:Uma2 family endonuclease